MSDHVTRRGFIRTALAGAAGLPLLLEACGGGTAAPGSAAPASSSPAAVGGAVSAKPAVSGAAPASGAAGGTPSGAAAAGANKGPLPSYIPFKLPGNIKPDFHSDDPRYDDGYNNYPSPAFKAWQKDPPGTGSTINVAIVQYYPPGTPRDSDPAWQEVEKQLNAKVIMNQSARADYLVKLATIMAGNDLPDIIHLPNVYSSAANLPDFFAAKCADLTPFLGGDNVKDYPFLANIPTYAWKNSISAVNGKLYMIPIQRYLPLAATQGGYFFKNTDMWDKAVGAGTMPKDADDFKKILQQLNNPKGGVWAFGQVAADPAHFGIGAVAQMFGAPNNWSYDSKSNKLVKDYETDQYKAAVGWLRDLWSTQLFWPDAPSPGNSRDNFVVGKFATTVDGYGNGWNDFWRRGLQNKPPNHFALITPFAATSGQKPLTFVSGGFISTNVLKAGPPERIKEVLRVIDFMAAPFGSQEDILLSYGLAPADYTLDAKGNPVLTDKSNPDAGYIPWRYICQHPQVSYQADIPGYAQACWDAEQAIIPISVDDPTQAFYSKTNFGGTATNARNTFGSGMNDIILGRRPMTDYDQLVKDWVSAVGDTIRKEYLDAMAAASK